MKTVGRSICTIVRILHLLRFLLSGAQRKVYFTLNMEERRRKSLRHLKLTASSALLEKARRIDLSTGLLDPISLQ